MNPIVITPPTGPVVSIEEIKEHCRVEADVTEFDEKLRQCVDAATNYIEVSTNVSMLTQTLQQDFATFRCSLITRRPFVEIVSVQYYDSSDDFLTLGTDVYRASPGVLGVALALQSSGTWPSVYDRTDAVRVTYKAGYPSWTKVPTALTASIKLVAGALFANRDGYTEKPLVESDILSKMRFPFVEIFV